MVPPLVAALLALSGAGCTPVDPSAPVPCANIVCPPGQACNPASRRCEVPPGL
jgi:hypothetical protein